MTQAEKFIAVRQLFDAYKGKEYTEEEVAFFQQDNDFYQSLSPWMEGFCLGALAAFNKEEQP